MTVKELKAELLILDQDVSGRKADLVARLRDARELELDDLDSFVVDGMGATTTGPRLTGTKRKPGTGDTYGSSSSNSSSSSSRNSGSRRRKSGAAKGSTKKKVPAKRIRTTKKKKKSARDDDDEWLP